MNLHIFLQHAQSTSSAASCFASGFLQYDVIIDATSRNKSAEELQDSQMFCHECSSVSISDEQEDFP